MSTESKPPRDADQSAKREPDSLDKLRDFTRRILAVPKAEIPPHKPKRRDKRKKRAR